MKSTLYELPEVTINKMQRVQNMCAHLVLRRSKWDNVMEWLATLHWLPIKQHITFKLCVLTFKLLHCQGPKYLQDLLQYKAPDKKLRLVADQHLLLMPRTKHKTFAARSFSVSAPTLWNTLPYHLRTSETLLKFKQGLKTHLYQEALASSALQNP